MRSNARSAAVFMVVLLVLCTIVSVEAQTPSNGQGNANVVAQNMDTNTSNPDAIVVASYLNPDGTEADDISTTTPPLAASEFLISDTSMGGPWQGSMVLYSDTSLATIVQMLWDGGPYGDGKTAAGYTGFSETSDTWYLPWVIVQHDAQVTQIAVQNADTGDVTVWLRYYRRGQSTPTAEVSEVIVEGGSRVYDLGSPGGKVPDLVAIDGVPYWEGAVVVEAEGSKQITAMSLTHWRGFTAAYQASSSTSQNLIGPIVMRRAYDQGGGQMRWAEFGILFLQNPNDTAADVDLDFYEAQTGSYDLHLDLTIPARNMRIVHLRLGGHVPVGALAPLDKDPGPDIVWTGKVEVASDLPILGVVLYKRGWEVAAMHVLADPAQGSNILYVPAAYRILHAGPATMHTRVLVANLSDQEATVDFWFYDRDGNMDHLLRRTAPANGTKQILTHIDSQAGPLGDNWVGSVHVTSTQPVVGIVDTLWEWGSARMATYNAPVD